MYGENQEEVFLGYSMGKQNNISESTSQKIDSEVRRLVESGLADATHILTTKKDDLESLAQGLLEYETLSGDEIRGILKGCRADPRDGRRARATPSLAGSECRERAAEARPRRRPGATALGLTMPDARPAPGIFARGEAHVADGAHDAVTALMIRSRSRRRRFPFSRSLATRAAGAVSGVPDSKGGAGAYSS